MLKEKEDKDFNPKLNNLFLQRKMNKKLYNRLKKTLKFIMTSKNNWRKEFLKWWHIYSQKLKISRESLNRNMINKWKSLSKGFLITTSKRLLREPKLLLNKIRRKSRLKKEKWDKLKVKWLHNGLSKASKESLTPSL